MRRFATMRTRLGSIWRAREHVKLPAYHVDHRLHHRPGADPEDSDAHRRIARRDPSPSASGCTLSDATTGSVATVTPDQGPSAASCHRLRTCVRPFYRFFVGHHPVEPAGLIPSVTNENLNPLRGAAARPYGRADESWAVQTLVHAFADDPVANHLFPAAEIRARGMAHVFKMALRSASRLGAMDVIPPDQAAAIWLRPEHPKPGLSQVFFAGALATPFLVGWQATRRMLRYERFVEELRFQLMGGRPHWYLFAIGILPSQQGRGLGSTLLATGRQRAATGGFPCYLETSNERNLAFYRRTCLWPCQPGLF